MKIMEVIEHGVAVLILSIIVFSILMAAVNCIVPMSKAEQSARMAPTLEIYRAFNLSPETLKAHNAQMDQQARLQFERQARGER